MGLVMFCEWNLCQHYFPNGFHSWHAVYLLHCISRVKVSVSTSEFREAERESLHVDYACASDRTYFCWQVFFKQKHTTKYKLKLYNSDPIGGWNESVGI